MIMDEKGSHPADVGPTPLLRLEVRLRFESTNAPCLEDCSLTSGPGRMDGVKKWPGARDPKLEPVIRSISDCNIIHWFLLNELHDQFTQESKTSEVYMDICFAPNRVLVFKNTDF